jgi:hypothetical protein
VAVGAAAAAAWVAIVAKAMKTDTDLVRARGVIDHASRMDTRRAQQLSVNPGHRIYIYS